MKFLILLPVVVCLVGSAPMTDDTEICVENYLKKLELVGSELGNDEGVTSSCNFMIPIIKKEIYKNFDSQLSEKDLGEHKECMIEKLKERDFATTILALSVYQDTTKIADEIKEEKLKEISKTMKGQLVLATLDCKLVAQFIEVFEEMLEDGSTESSESTTEEDYCARKYVVEKELFDTSYKLDLNPLKIDTTSINCEEYYPMIREQAEEELIASFTDVESSGEGAHTPFNETTTACATEAIKGENFIDKFLPFTFLREVKLTDEAKQNEQNKFVQVMRDFTQALLTMCFL